MKLKFTLERSGAAGVDLLATVDAATTIGQLADHVAGTDPAGSASAGGGLTLGLPDGRVLDPRMAVGESALRSGASVRVTRSGDAFESPSAAAAAAIVRVVGGPDAGKEFPLRVGTAVIGRERGCEVRLTDAMVSRQHARLNVSDVVEIVDLGSANGIGYGGAAVSRMVLRPDDVVLVGDSEISVRVVRRSGGAPGADSGALAFVRSPRLEPQYEGATFEAPEVPERPGVQRFPLLALVAPLLMGGVLYLVTKNVASLIFVGLSPLLLIGNALEARIGGRSAFRQALAQFRADVDGLLAEVRVAEQTERAARAAEHPTTAECAAAARDGSPLLWCRRPSERGFLELRLGTGARPSRTSIQLASARRAPRDLAAELAAAVAPFAGIDDVPVVARLADGAVGICGPRSAALAAARALVVQLVSLHSPAEVTMAGVASVAAAADWDWLKWLPHTSSPHSPVAARLLASNVAEATALVAELEELLGHRAADRRDRQETVDPVVLLVEDGAPADHSRIVQLADNGAAHGIHVVWIAADRTLLPAACRTFLELGPDGSAAAGYVADGSRVPVAAELADAPTAAAVARALAPVQDAGAPLDDDSDLPRAVSVFSLPGRPLAPSAEHVLERWQENRSIVTGPYAAAKGDQPGRRAERRAPGLRAVIGQSATGVQTVDLRSEGPHALVGGTTGSGKSELLQAWILGMAAAHSPQRLTFLLVDYKGGSAFRECVALPHTVGMVTDLSPHLVRRALVSLHAEVRHREEILAKYQAKDLAELERREDVTDAPPSLVIVVDEFAALVTEVPEFVDGMVNVAQRGRSLGLHLILATQRPAGVIKDNLRANTNLRLALRMADEEDSTDVLGSPQAAGFDPEMAGRAVVRTGPGRLVPFQTAYAGGWTPDEPDAPEIQLQELAFGTGRGWVLPESGHARRNTGPTDIQRLVRAARDASQAAALPAPRIPWLPELRAVYDLTALPVPVAAGLVFGIRDDPETQAQPVVAFQPDVHGNLVVYGTGGSGKSTFLRTIALAAGLALRTEPSHVYGLDFGARALGVLEELPHVGSIIAGSDHERLVRLLAWLREIIDERAQRYSRVNADTLTAYRTVAGAVAEPRILLLVDGVAAFRQAYETPDRQKWFDLFTSIAADGRPVGIHVVLSSDQRNGMSTALAAAVQQRVVLRLTTAEDYGMLGVPDDILTVEAPPGRGILNGAEVQVAVLGNRSDGVSQAKAVHAFGEAMRRAGATTAPAVGSLADRIALDALPPTAEGLPLLGVASSTLEPVGVQPQGVFLIAGPPGSGRTTAVHTLVIGLRRAHPDARLYWFGMRRSPASALPGWTGVALGAAQAADAAEQLRRALESELPGDAPVVVVVEGVTDLVGTEAESPLAELVRVCATAEAFVIAEGETSALGVYGPLLPLLKNARRGMALQPDQTDGISLFKTPFPRTNRAEFPPGRALLVERGNAAVVQVATAGH